MLLQGHEKTVEELIRFGAQINIKDNADRSVFEIAQKSGIL